MKDVNCPVCDFSCPYFKAFMCTMPSKDGCHPLNNCDDYGFAIENLEYEDEDDENYTLADLGNNWW